VRWIVYETRCLISGKIYVGVHRQDAPGFDGYFGSGRALKRAIKKHGVDAFERRTLFEFATDAEAYAREAEIVTEEFCKRRDTYNMKTGGMGGGGKHSPETRTKMSESRRGKKHSPEHCAKMSESLRGRNFSPEHCAKISESLRGRKLSPEHRASLRGKKFSPEHRAKMREAALRRWARRRNNAP